MNEATADRSPPALGPVPSERIPHPLADLHLQPSEVIRPGDLVDPAELEALDRDGLAVVTVASGAGKAREAEAVAAVLAAHGCRVVVGETRAEAVARLRAERDEAVARLRAERAAIVAELATIEALLARLDATRDGVAAALAAGVGLAEAQAEAQAAQAEAAALLSAPT